MAKFNDYNRMDNLGEKIIRNVIRDNLDNSYRVINNFHYDYKHRDNRYHKEEQRKGEIDVIIAHKKLGLVFIEVKGGEFGEDSTGIFRKDDSGKNYNIFSGNNNPFKATEKKMYEIMDFIAMKTGMETRDKLDIPYSYLVVFPTDRADVSENYDMHYIDADYCNHRFEKTLINNVESQVHDNKLSGTDTAMLDQAVKVLNYSIEIQYSAGPAIKYFNDEIIELTDEQKMILEDERFNRAIVSGGPGTGKSILAAEKAKKLAREGYNVLLICYNINLSEQLKIFMKDTGVVVCPWCEYMCDMVHEHDPSFRRPDPGAASGLQEFFHITVPDRFCGLLSDYDIQRPNAIVVDECQDMSEFLFYAILEYMEDSEHDPLIVFIDEKQNVFTGDFDIKKELRKHIDEEYTLPGTYRIAREVGSYINSIIKPRFIVPVCYPEGGRVVEKTYTDDDDQLARIAGAVKELHICGLSNRQILLISFSHIEESAVRYGIDGIKVINGRDEHTLLNDIGSKELLFYTVRTSKGLEADAVILIDLPLKNEIVANEDYAQLFFIGSTRAKYILYTFYRKG